MIIPYTLPTLPVPQVPFYSQFQDVSAVAWQKQACGIASLAMIIDFYKTDEISVDTLLAQGISADAYDEKVGWIYKGLMQVAKKYGLEGTTYDFGNKSTKIAFTELEKFLKEGPVIVSVHYGFNPKSTIPHLVVIDGIDKDIMYYNDPAAKTGMKQISTTDFLKAWKKRFIVIRPLKKISVTPVYRFPYQKMNL